MQNIYTVYFFSLRAFAVSLRLFAHAGAISRLKQKIPWGVSLAAEMFSSAIGNISNCEEFQLAGCKEHTVLDDLRKVMRFSQ